MKSVVSTGDDDEDDENDDGVGRSRSKLILVGTTAVPQPLSPFMSPFFTEREANAVRLTWMHRARERHWRTCASLNIKMPLTLLITIFEVRNEVNGHDQSNEFLCSLCSINRMDIGSFEKLCVDVVFGDYNKK